MEFAVDGAWLITPEYKVISDARVIVEDGKIVYAGPRDSSEASLSGHDRIYYPKGLIAPGFINGHTHIGETLVRGLCDDVTFQEWLYDHIWKVEPRMTADDCYWGTLLGCAEMISGGSIGFIDQYFYADKIASAVNEAGLKAFLFPSIFEPTPETKTMEEAFSKAIDVHKKWHGKDDRIFVGFGPHAPFTVDKDWLMKIVEKAILLETGIHIHLNETQQEVDDALQNWNCSPIEYCNKFGILDGLTLGAHCVHVTDKDMQILKEKEVSVLHCPQSNLKLANGIAPVEKMDENGINVCVGTDGQASNNNLDMLEELSFCAMVHKMDAKDPTVISAATALRFGTANPARIFPNNVAAGVIEEGVPADFVVYDMWRPNGVPMIHPLSNLIYSISSRNVVLTVCNGRILYQDGEYKTLKIEDVLTSCQKISERMVEEGFKEGL
ncbi:MAG: amidohydrolase family protein [Promethearchaeota archaeon]